MTTVIKKMDSIYCTPIIVVGICGHKFNIHKGVLDKMLVTGDVSDQWNIEGVYNYTIESTDTPPTFQFCDNIVRWLYTESIESVDLNSVAYYQFFDKYAKDRTILDNCFRRKCLIDKYDTLVKWINGTVNGIEERETYEFLATVLYKYARKVYNNTFCWSFIDKHKITTVKEKGDLVLHIVSPDKFCLFILEHVHNTGHNIWDTWKEVTRVTDEELLHYGISLDNVPDKFTGKK